MSGLYLLALSSIWLVVGWLIRRTWLQFKPEDWKRRILHMIVGVLLFLLWFGGPFWQFAGKKMYWDAKVREWCAKDGGIQVYETVELTPDLIDWAGRVWIPYKKDAKHSDKYFIETERFYFRTSNPQVFRRQARIIRQSDGKVLGEKITYHRGGSDLPGFWHPSGFSCYDITRDRTGFETSVFIKGDKK